MSETLQLVRDEIPHYYQEIPGFFWFQECYGRLLRTLPLDTPSTWVEIGCFQGQSLCWLGVEAINQRIPVAIHGVDSFEAWPSAGLQGKALETACRGHVAPLIDRLDLTIHTARSVDAAKLFADDSIDVVFVDGSHEYDEVIADIGAWWPKLKPGALMAGDDFMMEPVMRAVTETFAPSGYILVHGWATNPKPVCWPSWIARKA